MALLRLVSGAWTAQAVHVAARLGIADLLADGPKAPDMLAAATGAHGPTLGRLLRALASLGVFAEQPDGRFGLTPLAGGLRRDAEGSLRDYAVMMGDEWHWRAWGELLHSVQTGKTGFEKLHGEPIFDYLGKHPDEAAVFDQAMVAIHGRETAAIIAAYDFSQFHEIIDLGGGNGSQLCEILAATPEGKGVVFDLAHVIKRAKATIATAGLDSRCRTVGGSFFDSVPAGADAYILRHIIHDWDDEKSLTILRNIHRAMGPDGRLLLVEGVIPPGNEPCFGKLLDLTMLTIPGGKERTAEEYRTLLRAAGFDLTRIVPTQAEVSVIEGKKL